MGRRSGLSVGFQGMKDASFSSRSSRELKRKKRLHNRLRKGRMRRILRLVKSKVKLLKYILK